MPYLQYAFSTAAPSKLFCHYLILGIRFGNGTPIRGPSMANGKGSSAALGASDLGDAQNYDLVW